MNNTQDLKSIEITIDQARAAVTRMGCLRRLENNPDFKELILKDFMKEHAVRTVNRIAHPAYQSDRLQKELLDNITAVAQFNQFLHSITTLGESAEASLSAYEDTREEILAEELNNG